MGDIIANFAGFGVLLYVGVMGIIELINYNDLFKTLKINKNFNSGTILGYGDVRTLKRLKKANIYSTVVSLVTALIFLYQAIPKLIIYIKD